MRASPFLYALSLAVAGCAPIAIEGPQASISTVQAMRATAIPPLAVGTFARAENMSAQDDLRMSLRAATITAPQGSNFSSYMGDVLREQLRITGKLAPDSPFILSGLRTKGRANPAIGKASGALAYRFLLTRNGQAIFEKELEVSGRWNSSFIGALAIPEAEKQFVALYPELLTLLFNDPDFQTALRTAS